MSPVPASADLSSLPNTGSMSSQANEVANFELAYEEYEKELQELSAAARRGEAGQMVIDRINELRNLFASMTDRNVKELSMYMKDSDALLKTAEFASINAEHVRYGTLGGTLSTKDFLRAAKIYMNPDLAHEVNGSFSGADALELSERFNSFDWKKLGLWFYLRGRVPVPSHFLYGPLATQRRRMAPRTRTVDDTVSTAAKTAQKVTASDLQEDPEQNTSHMVRSVYEVLKEGDPEAKVSLYRFFVNPLSFAQSVENLFYTSFLVKDGKLRLDVGADKMPYVVISDEDPDDIPQEDRSPLAHHIASFDYATWTALIDKYSITESFIPHRATEEDVMSDFSEDGTDDTAADEDM